MEGRQIDNIALLRLENQHLVSPRFGNPVDVLRALGAVQSQDYAGAKWALAQRTRVCTYDRAGDGLSDARPASVRPLTGATQAKELHTMLAVILSCDCDPDCTDPNCRCGCEL